VGRSLLPPDFVHLPSRLVYGDVPAPIFRTAARIIGLGYRYKYTRTDPIGFEKLMEICDVGRSQLYAHLAWLRAKGVLDYVAHPGRMYAFTFESCDGVPTSRASPEIRTGRAIDVVVDSSPHPGEITHDRESGQQQQLLSDVGGGVGGGGRQSGKPDERLAILQEIGVLEPTRSEILSCPDVTVDYLAAWRDWYVHECAAAALLGRARIGVGLVVLQLRQRAAAPVLSATERRRVQEYRRRKDLSERFAEVAEGRGGRWED
jgi:hypothetical protein